MTLNAELRSRLVELRRDFHRYPELAHQEHRTAGVIAERLRALGLDDVRTGVGRDRRRRRAARRRGRAERSCCAPTWTRCRSPKPTVGSRTAR